MGAFVDKCASNELKLTAACACASDNDLKADTANYAANKYCQKGTSGAVGNSVGVSLSDGASPFISFRFDDCQHGNIRLSPAT